MWILRICAIVLVVALGSSITVRSESNPKSVAIGLIEKLTARGALPPIAALAELDAADTKVCHALGSEVKKLPEASAGRIVKFMAESSNVYAHAALLLGLTSDKAAIVSTCLRSLTSLEFSQIQKLRKAGEKLDPNLFESLETENYMQDAMRNRVTELATQGTAKILSDEAVHGAISLALMVDLYAGENGAKELVDVLVELMVGSEPIEEFDVNEDPTGPDEDNEEEGEGDKDEPKRLNAEQERKLREYALMTTRRHGAQKLYRLLMIRDPDKDQIGKIEYETRKKAGAEFWKRYEERVEDKFTSWRNHILNVFSYGESPDDKLNAMLMMDVLFGGVKIPVVDKEEKSEDEDEEEEMPIFEGATDKERIDNYGALDTREKARRRRFIKRKFIEVYGDKKTD